jgi:hypothetical protein
MLPDSVLLCGIFRVNVGCGTGRLYAFLPLYSDGSGTAVYAGPCPCGGNREKCDLPRVGLPDFDLDKEISRAERLVAKADSLPQVIVRAACPKGCAEDHVHSRHGFRSIIHSTFADELVPYARRCLSYERPR